jgi:hypothetical protein
MQLLGFVGHFLVSGQDLAQLGGLHAQLGHGAQEVPDVLAGAALLLVPDGVEAIGQDLSQHQVEVEAAQAVVPGLAHDLELPNGLVLARFLDHEGTVLGNSDLSVSTIIDIYAQETS